MRNLAVHSPFEDERNIDITPMLDVVFILLIFFIVTATFVKESGLDVNRPAETSPLPIDDAKNVLVRIGPNDEIWINNRLVDLRAVRPNIERLHAENPEATVVIQPNEESKTDTLVQVMDASRSAGVFNISISGQES